LKTKDNVEIYDGMTVWLDGYVAPVVWGVVSIDEDENLKVHFGPTVEWDVFASDLYSTEDAAIAALIPNLEGGQPC